MSKSIDAIYEGGVFKPLGPVSLSESQQVRLIIEPPTEDTRQWVIEHLKSLGHLQGQPLVSVDSAEALPEHDDLQKMLPQLDPPLSKQLLDDRR